MPQSPEKLAWVKGGASPNPLGRKLGQNSIRRAVERFVRRNTNAAQLQRMFDELASKDQLTLLTMLFPYVLSKKETSSEWDGLDDDQVETIYQRLLIQAKQERDNKKTNSSRPVWSDNNNKNKSNEQQKEDTEGED